MPEAPPQRIEIDIDRLRAEFSPRRWEALRVLCKTLFRLYFRGKVFFQDRVPAQGGALLVSNHGSNLDPPLTAMYIRRYPFFLAKAELFHAPVLRSQIPRLQALPLRREGVDREGMKRCLQLLGEGEMLLAFPEGTRTRDGSLGRGKPGVAMLAAQAGVPCVPCYLENTHRAMPRGVSFPRPARLRIAYGHPFDLPPREKGEAARDYYQRCADAMMQAIAATRDEMIAHDGA